MKKLLLVLFFFVSNLFAQNSILQLTNFDFDVAHPVVSQSEIMSDGHRGLLIFEAHNGDSSNIVTMSYWEVMDSLFAPRYITRDGYINKNPIYYNYNRNTVIIWQTNRNGNFDIAYCPIDYNGDFGEIRIATNTPEDEEQVKPVINQGEHYINSIYVIFKRGDKIIIKDITDETSSEDTIFTDNGEITFSQPAATFSSYSSEPKVAVAICDSAGVKKLVYRTKEDDLWSEIKTIDIEGVPNNPSFSFHYYPTLFCEYELSSRKSIYRFRISQSEIVVDTLYSDSSASYSNFQDAFVQIQGLEENFVYPHVVEKKEGGQTYIIARNTLNCEEYDTIATVSVSEPQPSIGIMEYNACFLPLYSVWIDSAANGHKNIFGYKSYIVIGDVAEKNAKANGFQLFQNYPNPFNPTTVINYVIASSDLSERGNLLSGQQQIASSQAPRNDGAVQVSLKIYDALGREVATLVNAKQMPGKYSVQFNANSALGGLPSGVYFYALRAGNFVQTRKMILLK